jgi:hypothetical protein
MGHGEYSADMRSLRATSFGYYTKSSSEIFSSKQINSAMNPHGVQLRESRDSNDHPNSLAIVLALDVTGSMGSIPHHLVKDGLPTIVDNIIKKGVKDPQILFLGIGDHECDSSPLQVSQFESSDELLDKWLTSIYLEGGGGGNDGESYLLAWYFAGHRTAIDCFEKRSQKGFLFTIGDEPCLNVVPKSKIQGIMGEGQYEDFNSKVLLDKAREKYNVYHIHVRETSSGSRQKVMDGWKQLMSDNLIIANRHEEIPDLIANTIIEKYSQKVTNSIVNDKPMDTTEIIL